MICGSDFRILSALRRGFVTGDESCICERVLASGSNEASFTYALAGLSLTARDEPDFVSRSEWRSPVYNRMENSSDWEELMNQSPPIHSYCIIFYFTYSSKNILRHIVLILLVEYFIYIYIYYLYIAGKFRTRSFRGQRAEASAISAAQNNRVVAAPTGKLELTTNPSVFEAATRAALFMISEGSKRPAPTQSSDSSSNTDSSALSSQSSSSNLQKGSAQKHAASPLANLLAAQFANPFAEFAVFDGSAHPAHEVRRVDLSFCVSSSGQGAAAGQSRSQSSRLRLAVLLTATVRDAIGLSAYAYNRARMQPALRCAEAKATATRTRLIRSTVHTTPLRRRFLLINVSTVSSKLLSQSSRVESRRRCLLTHEDYGNRTVFRGDGSTVLVHYSASTVFSSSIRILYEL